MIIDRSKKQPRSFGKKSKNSGKSINDIFKSNWASEYNHYFVSPDCAVCKTLSNYDERLNASKPRKNFSKRKLKLVFSRCADMKDQNAFLGVTPGSCPWCIVRPLSTHTLRRGVGSTCVPIPETSKDPFLANATDRTTDQGNADWSRFKKLVSTALDKTPLSAKDPKKFASLIVRCRDKCRKQQRKPLCESFKRLDFRVGELQTVMSIVDRIFEKLFQVARYLDLYLIKENWVSSQTEDAYTQYVERKEKYLQTKTSISERKLSQAYEQLININGPYESKLFELLLSIGAIPRKELGGKLIGDQAYAILNYPEIVDMFQKRKLASKRGRSIIIGSETFVNHMKTYINLRRRECALTCLGRNLCCKLVGYTLSWVVQCDWKDLYSVLTYPLILLI